MNQRKESRKKLMAFTPVYDLLHKSLLGYVADLTAKGVMVAGEKPVETDKHLTLGIEFPEGGEDGSVIRVVIPSRAAWCRPDPENSQAFNVGFEFTEVTPENDMIINSVLERYQFRPALDKDFKF